MSSTWKEAAVAPKETFARSQCPMGPGHPERWCVALRSASYSIVHWTQQAHTEAGEHVDTDIMFMSFLCLTCLCLHPQILWWPESNSLSSGIFPKNFRPEYFFILLNCCYTGNIQVLSTFHSCSKGKYHFLEDGGQRAEPSLLQPNPSLNTEARHSNSALCSKQEWIMKGEWADWIQGPKQNCQWEDSRRLCFAASGSQITRALDMQPVKPNPSPYL